MAGFTYSVTDPTGENETPVDLAINVGYTGILNWPDPINYVKITSGHVAITANDGGANHGNEALSGFPVTFLFGDPGPTVLTADNVALEAGRSWKFQTILTYVVQYLGFPLQTGLTKILPSEVTYSTFSTAAVRPVLTYPGDELTNVYLNEDWLQNFLWEDDDPYPLSAYTVWFWRPSTGWVAQTDRSRYSIIFYKLNLEGAHEYNTTYYWYVRKDLGGGEYVDSATWSFTTLVYAPPTYSTREKTPYGGGDPITVPTGENNQIVVRRVVAAAKNRIFYEDV